MSTQENSIDEQPKPENPPKEHNSTLSFKRDFSYLQYADFEEESSCFPEIRKMRGWKSFFVLTICGFILFASVGIVLTILDPVGNYADLNVITPANMTAFEISAKRNELVSLQPQLVRWSFYVTFLWESFVFLWFFVTLLPGIIIHLIIAFIGFCSEQTRTKMEYIPALQSYIVWMMWQGLAVGSFKVIFIQMNIVEEWQVIFNYLLSAFFFSVIFLAQRIFVQKIAFDFHKVIVF